MNSNVFPPPVDFDAEFHNEDERIFRKVIFRLVPFFCLCYFFPFLDRVNIGIAKLQMLGDLRFSDTVYGLGAGLFFITYVLFEIPSNLLLNRVGAKLGLGRILLTWGVLACATAFVKTPMQFYGVRLLLGAAEAGFVPGVLLYLTRWFPSRRRGKVLGMFLVGMPVSSFIGGPLSGWAIKVSNGMLGLAGWQWLFLLEGIPVLLLSIVIFFYLPDTLHKADWLTSKERIRLIHHLTVDEAAPAAHSAWAGLADVKVWLLGAICLTAGGTVYLVSFWLPTILTNEGVHDSFQVGILTSIANAAAVAMMMLVSANSDRTKERRWHVSTMLILTAAGLFGSTLFQHSVFMTMIMFVVANACVWASLPVFWCLPGQLLSGSAAAAGFALINAIGSAGGFVATFLLSWMKSRWGSIDGGLITFSLMLLLAAVVILKLSSNSDTSDTLSNYK
jgi:MFS family permease